MIMRVHFRHSELPAALLSLPRRFRPKKKDGESEMGGRAVAVECDYVSKVRCGAERDRGEVICKERECRRRRREGHSVEGKEMNEAIVKRQTKE